VVNVTHSSAPASPADENIDAASPRHSASTGRRAIRVKLAWSTAAGWFAAILLALALKIDDVKEVLAVAISAVGATGAVLAAFGTHLAKARLPSITSRPATAAVGVVLVAELLFSLGWPGLSAYRASREVDVLDQVDPPEFRAVLPGGEVTVNVPVRRDRSAIALQIEITDHNPGSGVCVPFTTVTVRRANRTIHAVPKAARHRQRITIGAPRTGDRVSLDMEVGNALNDRNCAVDLTVSTAHLTNDD
jgi:hypothetical protein